MTTTHRPDGWAQLRSIAANIAAADERVSVEAMNHRRAAAAVRDRLQRLAALCDELAADHDREAMAACMRGDTDSAEGSWAHVGNAHASRGKASAYRAAAAEVAQLAEIGR